MRDSKHGGNVRMVLLAGSSHPTLTSDIASVLKHPLGHCRVDRFPDGEFDIEVDRGVRGAHVFIVQSLHSPVGDHLLELCLIADASWRQGAVEVTAVIPYLGYARHDRREVGQEPLGARVVAELIAAGRIDRIICLDLHSRAVEGCFNKPVDHANATEALTQAMVPYLQPNSVVVSPDLGAVKRAEGVARALKLPVAIVHKQRLSGTDVQTHGVVGNVENKHPIIVDDLISTGGTIVAAIEAIVHAGALAPMIVAASHGLFVGPAAKRLAHAAIDRIIVTDSVPMPADVLLRVQRVRSAPAIAQIISRMIDLG